MAALKLLDTLLEQLALVTSPINTIESAAGIDWDDRIALQSRWSLREKGWQVKVEWKQTPYGCGLFAAEDIAAGSIIRIGLKGKNQLEFQNLEELEAFLVGPSSSNKKANSSDKAFQSRVRYVGDYVYGFNRNADKRGYPVAGKDSQDRWFGCWIPGNGINHSKEANTLYSSAPGGTNEGVNLVALCDITKGEQLFDDYRRHGNAPQWMREFANKYNVASLVFPDCNDFVMHEQ
mmetsp:Transcript_51502/g.85342  ORF Transcript_51502/g.85342 Transcript_51502/m.85342 type:complete len:234 (-) Transcript_51502:19-720(-)